MPQTLSYQAEKVLNTPVTIVIINVIKNSHQIKITDMVFSPTISVV